MVGETEIEIARQLFAAWSSGEVDAPGAFLTEDAVLHDVTDGADKVGWEAIRRFYGVALQVWPDLRFEVHRFFPGEEGLAVRWTMTGLVQSDIFGPEAKGKRWRTEGMSELRFRDGKVCYEADFHHGGAIARSVGAG